MQQLQLHFAFIALLHFDERSNKNAQHIYAIINATMSAALSARNGAATLAVAATAAAAASNKRPACNSKSGGRRLVPRLLRSQYAIKCLWQMFTAHDNCRRRYQPLLLLLLLWLLLLRACVQYKRNHCAAASSAEKAREGRNKHKTTTTKWNMQQCR